MSKVCIDMGRLNSDILITESRLRELYAMRNVAYKISQEDRIAPVGEIKIPSTNINITLLLELVATIDVLCRVHPLLEVRKQCAVRLKYLNSLKIL